MPVFNVATLPRASILLTSILPVISFCVRFSPAVIIPFESTVTFEYVPATTPLFFNVDWIETLSVPSKETLPVTSPARLIVLASASFEAFSAAVAESADIALSTYSFTSVSFGVVSCISLF